MSCEEICNEIHVNDIGTLFKITIKDCETIVDLSAVDIKQIIFKKPNGASMTKDATFFTDGTDGIITYVSVAGDIDVVGIWKMQAYLKFGSSEFYSNIYTFKVHRNLP